MCIYIGIHQRIQVGIEEWFIRNQKNEKENKEPRSKNEKYMHDELNDYLKLVGMKHEF